MRPVSRLPIADDAEMLGHCHRSRCAGFIYMVTRTDPCTYLMVSLK